MKAIGIINHLKSIYLQRVLFTLYNSLIFFHVLSGILLWGKSNNVDKIAKLQKRAIRTISFSRPIANIQSLKFNNTYSLKFMIFFYKVSNNSLLPYFA